MKNRVFIALALSDDRAVNEERARLATAMLNKLHPANQQRADRIFFDGERYCVTISSTGDYLVLADSGHWFDLEALAK